MTESAAPRDVRDRRARTVWSKAFERKRYDGVKTPVPCEPLHQLAFEPQEACAVRDRGAQALAQLAGRSVAPEGGHIDMGVGDMC